MRRTGDQTYCWFSFLTQISSVLLLGRSLANVKLFGLHFEPLCFWSFLIVYHISHVPTSWNRLDYLPVYSNTSLLIKWLKGKAIPINGPWKSIGLWDVEAATFSRQSAHRWLWGQPYAQAASYPQENSWYSFLLETESTPGTIVRLEGWGQLKNPMTS
jgi:hypothetical protein